MFWLFFLFRRTRDTFQQVHGRQLLLQAMALLGVALSLWAVLAALLWAGGIVISTLLVIALAAVVYHLDRKHRQRETWIASGHCGNCGYSLRGLTTAICPECGHDTAIEEPTWRKRQREHQLRFGALAAQPPTNTPLPPPVVHLTPAPRVR